MTQHFSEFFPGSRHSIPRTAKVPSQAVAEDRWDGSPREYRNPRTGEVTEYFTIGALAKALHREPVTIRRWEREGILPKPPFNKPGKDGDTRGRRRLYTRAHVEGLVKLAIHHGILPETWRAIPPQFTEEAINLYRGIS